MPPRKNRMKIPELARKKPCTRNGGGRSKIPKTRPRRGLLVHRENKEYQEKTGLLTPRTGMHRLIREVAGHHKDIRIAACAVDAIHQVAENYLINRFQAANVCCHHGRRVTVMQKDFKLSEEIICTLGHWAKAMGSKSV